MPQERSDNTLQQKLDQLSALPEGIRLDASSAWTKMELALHPKPKSKRTFYYVAAACLIFSMTGALIFKEDKKAPTHSILVTERFELKPRIVQAEADKHQAENKTEELFTKPVKKDIKVVATVSEDPVPTGEATVEKNLAITPVSTTPIETEQKVITKPAESTVASSTVRRFRIVHNNETFVERQTDVAKRTALMNTGFPLFRSTQPIEPSSEEPQAEEAIPHRKRDKPFIKSLTTLKED